MKTTKIDIFEGLVSGVRLASCLYEEGEWDLDISLDAARVACKHFLNVLEAFNEENRN